MEKKCVFCEINQEKNRVISESNNIIVILSNPALVKGHCLVIPKRHIEKLSELNDKEKEEIFSELIKIQNNLLKKFSGVDIRQNYRPFLPQSRLKVDHLHFHLIPREFEDELYKRCMIFEKEIFKEINQEEAEKAKKLILK